jgi:MFS transporter, DHA2 family, multidrug resistance protein
MSNNPNLLIDTETPYQPPTGTERLLITLSIIMGTLMGAIDMSIINVALPNIRASLGVTLTEISWVATGYLIAVVVILPLTSWLASVIGRKNLYLIALVIFTASSLCCGLSPTLPVLLFFRLLQGLGAGLMQPIAMAILREIYPPREQAMAMGIFGIAVLLGPAIGPTLGGWLTDNYGWPWIFYINIPIGAVTFFMASQFLFDPPYLRRQHASSVDATGIILLTIGLAALQTVLSEGQNDDWFESTFIVATSIISAVALITFVFWELRHKNPAVDLTILRNIPFTSGTMLGGVLGLALFGSMFLLPMFMEGLLGYDAMQSGIAMLPRSLVMMAGMPIAGRLYNRLGPRPLIGAGLILSAIAAFQMGKFTPQTSYMGLVIPQIWQGIAFSMIFVSLSTAALASIPRPRMTNASALYNLVRQLGGSFGIAIIATMLEARQNGFMALLSQHLNPYNPAFVSRFNAISHALVMKGVSTLRAQKQALAILNGLSQQQAASMAFDYVFMVVGLLFIITLPLVLLLRSHHDHAPKPEITE